MSRAQGAIVRAVSEDLGAQAGDIAVELRQSAGDAKKPPEERNALELLARSADAMSRATAANLERHLEETKSAETLANSPSFGADAAALNKAATDLVEMAEHSQRTVQLRNALKTTENATVAAKDALERQASPAAAIAQQQTAAELKESTVEFQNALQAAINVVDANVLTKVLPLTQSPLPAKAIELLNQRATQTLSGETPDPKFVDTQQQALKELKQELDKQTPTVREATQALNGELKAMAQAWVAANPELTQPVAKAEEKPAPSKITGEEISAMTQKLRAAAEHDRKAAEYIDRARALEEHARERLKVDAPAVAQALRAAGHDADAVAKSNPANPVAPALQAAEKALTKAAQDNEDLAKRTDMLPLAQLADKLSAVSQDVEKSATDIAMNLGKAEDAATQSAQKIGQQVRGFAGWDADRAAELRRAARAEQLARENAQESNGSRAELEKQVLAELDALDKPLNGKLDQSIVSAVRKSAGDDVKQAAAPTPEPKLETLAQRAQNGAQALEQLAARTGKIAQNALSASSNGSASTGAGGEKSDPKHEGGESASASTGTEKVANPPAGIPIDKSTWNRLPDDLRRDLLNAAGGRFPAEYELSIRRYFKNVAASQQSAEKK